MARAASVVIDALSFIPAFEVTSRRVMIGNVLGMGGGF